MNYKLLSADELNELYLKITMKSVIDAVNTYCPDFMHGSKKGEYLNFLDKLDHSKIKDDIDDNCKIAYVFLEYLSNLEKSDNWESFLKDALNECLSQKPSLNEKLS